MPIVDPFEQPTGVVDPFDKAEPAAIVDPFEASTIDKLTSDPDSPVSGLIGLLETGAQMATGTVGAARGLIRGTLSAAVPSYRGDRSAADAFTEEFNRTAEATTYQPRTEAGKGISEFISIPFKKAEELGEERGETVRQRAMAAGASPESAGAQAAFSKTLIAGVPYAIATGLGMRGGKGPKTPTEVIDVAKELPVPPESVIARVNTKLAEQTVAEAKKPISADQATNVLREELRTVSSDALQKVQGFLTTDLSTIEIPRAGTNPKQNFVNYLVTTEDAKKALLATQALNKARPSQSLAQIKQAALDEGKTIKDLLGDGSKLDATTVMTYKSVLAAAGKNLEALREKARTGTETEKALFAAQFQETMKLIDQFDGVKSEWGRTGRVLREPVSDEIARANAIKKLNDNSFGGLGVNELVTLTDGMNTAELLSFATNARKATTPQKVLEAWKAGLLTGLRTHEANLASNLMAQGFALQEQAVAACLGKLIPRGATKDQVYFRELPAQVGGMVNGAIDGSKLAYEVLRRGETAADASKALDVTGRYEAIPGKLGEAVRTPYRVLAAEDKLFKEMASQGHLHSLAVRQAIKEGRKGKEATARVEELLSNPTPAMLKQSQDMAAYLTFNKELGEFGQAAQRMISKNAAMQALVPFVRTPTNVIKFAGERTPFALFSKAVREDLAKGGATRDTAIAKMMVGTGYAAAAYWMADQGLITGGGPIDPGERAVWLGANQPYSIKVGDQTYAYNRFEPMGTLFGASADVNAVWQAATTDEQAKLGAMLGAAVTRNITNKTMVAGLSSAVLAQTDPGRYGERFVNNLTGSVIPTIAAEVAQSRDPIYHEIDSVVDAIKARTPGLSETLYPKRDLYGRPITRHGGGAEAFLVSPGKDVQTDPAYLELARLKLAITPPERKIDGKEMDLSMYDRYAQDAGDIAYRMVSKLVQHPGYQAAPAFLQKELVQSSFSEARKIARVYHGIDKQRVESKINKMTKELGNGAGASAVQQQ